eukprot:1159056-Pelagomonas_calceolata.AAC.2
MSIACTGCTLLLPVMTCKVHNPLHSWGNCSPKAQEFSCTQRCSYNEDLLMKGNPIHTWKSAAA